MIGRLCGFSMGVGARIAGLSAACVASYAAYHTLHTRIWDRAEVVHHRINEVRQEIPAKHRRSNGLEKNVGGLLGA